MAGSTGPAAPPGYFARNWQTEDGLPQNSVNAVLQASSGYLWLGTFNGLVRFDGVRFTVYDAGNTPELKNGRITSLFEDSRGRLWIGHETGDVTRLEAGRFHAVETRSNNSGGVLSFGENAEGEIWMLNGRGALFGLENGQVFPPSAEGVAARSTISAVRDDKGQLWVVRNGELSAIANGKPQGVSLNGSGVDFVQAACAAREGGLWLVNLGSIRRWADGKWSTERQPCPVLQHFVTVVGETASGRLLLGTQEEGLFLLGADGTARQFSHTNGLSDDWVRSLCEDREGNLWIGTGDGGLNVLRTSRVFEVTPPDHWRERAVLSVCEARDGGLWIGTEGAGLYHFRGGVWRHFGEAEGLANLFVWSALEARDGQVWAGSWGGGLFEGNDGRFSTPAPLKNFSATVTALYQDSHSNIWAGTDNGLLRFSSGQATWYGRQESPPLSGIRAIAEDAEAAIWFGMSGSGLGRLKGGSLLRFSKADGLASEFLQSLHVDTDGALWIGSFGEGLIRRKNGRFQTIGTRQGLPNNVILAIEDDGQGHFWMSSHGGLFRVDKAELNRCADDQTQTLHSLLYGKSEGLPTLECSGGFQPVVGKTPDGRLWFPTRKGLVALSPGAVHTNELAPTVLLEEVLVDGHLAELPTNGAAMTIQPGQGRLKFRYTGLCFSAPEQVLFKHRLEDFEQDWVETGTERTVEYSYLPPGQYTFNVAACNKDGIWSEAGASIALKVLPHFWQTWTFRILGAVFTAASAGGVVLLVTRRRMRQKLERLERQQAVERERARIAQDIHDDLGANLTRITMLSQPGHDEPDHNGQKSAAMDQIYQTARDLTRAMDEIVWAVNPRHDSLDSLATYLGKLAQDFLRPVGIRCRLEIPMHLPALPLSAEFRHNLFLAFKEALNNVVKHSGASEVRIFLVLNSDGFELVVEDNGRGFASGFSAVRAVLEPDRAASGNGLSNMRRRLDQIAGNCEILSAPGNGTKVRFSVRTNRATKAPNAKPQPPENHQTPTSK